MHGWRACGRELGRQLSGLVLFHPIRKAYLSSFFHYSTERPMAIIVGQESGLVALVPHLEQDHIAAVPGVDRVMVYPSIRSAAPSIRCATLAICCRRWG